MRGWSASLRRTVVVALSLSALGLILCSPAQAATPRDRIVITGAVDVRPGQSVDDVVIADGPVAVRGRVDGSVVALHGRVFINGPVEDDVVVVDSDAVRLGPRARIGGDLLYRGARPAAASRAVAGDVEEVDVDEISGGLGFAAAAALWLAASVSTLVFGLLLLLLAPRAAEAAYAAAGSATGIAIAWGFALVLGLPLLALIALVSLVGIPFGIGLLLALFPIYALGYVTSAWLLGRRLLGPPRGRVLSFLAGWGILRLVAIVPGLGALVWLGAAVFGLGVLLVAAWRAREPRGPAQPEPAVSS